MQVSIGAVLSRLDRVTSSEYPKLCDTVQRSLVNYNELKHDIAALTISTDMNEINISIICHEMIHVFGTDRQN